MKTFATSRKGCRLELPMRGLQLLRSKSVNAERGQGSVSQHPTQAAVWKLGRWVSLLIIWKPGYKRQGFFTKECDNIPTVERSCSVKYIHQVR